MATKVRERETSQMSSVDSIDPFAKMSRHSGIFFSLTFFPLASSLLLSAGSARKGYSGSRRDLLAAAGVTAMLPRAVLATGNMPAVQGAVTTMDGSVKAAKTPEAAKKQIVAGYAALGRLLDDFDKISAESGGDGIRRVLGTVGTESPVYLIEPAFRLLFDADESLPMEYIEGVESVMQNISEADSEAYSAIFIEFSSAKGKPADYFLKSKAAVVRVREQWLGLMKTLAIK